MTIEIATNAKQSKFSVLMRWIKFINNCIHAQSHSTGRLIDKAGLLLNNYDLH